MGRLKKRVPDSPSLPIVPQLSPSAPGFVPFPGTFQEVTWQTLTLPFPSWNYRRKNWFLEQFLAAAAGNPVLPDANLEHGCGIAASLRYSCDYSLGN